jgi:hypothetical protein
MMKYGRSKREGGTILPIALVLLLLLTMIGIAATMTSEVEIRIAGNEVAYKENFYYAEGSAMAGVQILSIGCTAAYLTPISPVIQTGVLKMQIRHLKKGMGILGTWLFIRGSILAAPSILAGSLPTYINTLSMGVPPKKTEKPLSKWVTRKDSDDHFKHEATSILRQSKNEVTPHHDSIG